ncbi:hypothetical protein ACLF3G_27620 [Falsiroseomonas sp. HC035]
MLFSGVWAPTASSSAAFDHLTVDWQGARCSVRLSPGAKSQTFI